MTKSYLSGKIDSMTYYLDFPYEVETRYKKLLKEDKGLTELIYDCLVEDGVNLYKDLTEKEFKEKKFFKEIGWVDELGSVGAGACHLT